MPFSTIRYAISYIFLYLFDDVVSKNFIKISSGMKVLEINLLPLEKKKVYFRSQTIQFVHLAH